MSASSERWDGPAGARALEAYLRAHIPLTAALGVRVVRSGPDDVVLSAPFGPNRNHEDTAFGGSIAALGILAGWCRVHLGLRAAGRRSRVVVQRSRVSYLEPLRGDLTARARAVPAEAWDRFLRTLDRRGRGRIAVEVVLEGTDGPAAEVSGSYVALVRPAG